MMLSEEPWKAYPPKRENLLSMLHAVQHAHGKTSHIPTEELAAIAAYLGIPLAELDGVTSFYHAFSRKPRGRHVIRLCDSLSCRVRGSVDVYRHIKERLGIGTGETTGDGRYSLEIVNCLGSCDTAPNVMIDDLLLTEVTPERFDRALEEIEVAELEEVR
jgi:NADH:ubiquinone oxidoreductase subunit E